MKVMSCWCFSFADQVQSNKDQRYLGNLERATANKAHPSNPIQFKSQLALGQVSAQGTRQQGIRALQVQDNFTYKKSSEFVTGTHSLSVSKFISLTYKHKNNWLPNSFTYSPCIFTYQNLLFSGLLIFQFVISHLKLSHSATISTEVEDCGTVATQPRPLLKHKKLLPLILMNFGKVVCILNMLKQDFLLHYVSIEQRVTVCRYCFETSEQYHAKEA